MNTYIGDDIIDIYVSPSRHDINAKKKRQETDKVPDTTTLRLPKVCHIPSNELVEEKKRAGSFLSYITARPKPGTYGEGLTLADIMVLKFKDRFQGGEKKGLNVKKKIPGNYLHLDEKIGKSRGNLFPDGMDSDRMDDMYRAMKYRRSQCGKFPGGAGKDAAGAWKAETQRRALAGLDRGMSYILHHACKYEDAIDAFCRNAYDDCDVSNILDWKTEERDEAERRDDFLKRRVAEMATKKIRLERMLRKRTPKMGTFVARSSGNTVDRFIFGYGYEYGRGYSEKSKTVTAPGFGHVYTEHIDRITRFMGPVKAQEDFDELYYRIFDFKPKRSRKQRHNQFPDDDSTEMVLSTSELNGDKC